MTATTDAVRAELPTAVKFSKSRRMNIFTTGEVAKITGVSPRTVSKWFDSGWLHGYRIPGCNDRRIPRDSLLRFLRENNMPAPSSLGRAIGILGVGWSIRQAREVAVGLPDASLSDTEVRACLNAFALGRDTQERPWDLIILDLSELGTWAGCDLAAQLAVAHPDVPRWAMITEDGPPPDDAVASFTRLLPWKTDLSAAINEWLTA